MAQPENTHLTQADLEYIQHFKKELNKFKWDAILENNTYCVTCRANTFYTKELPNWKEMKEQFINALVSYDTQFSFRFPIHNNGTLDTPFEHIYSSKVSPSLVAHTLKLLGKNTYSLQQLLTDSLTNFNIAVVKACLEQEYSYQHCNVFNSAPFYSQFNQMQKVLKQMLKQQPTYQNELSLAFIEHLRLSDIKVGQSKNITKTYLLTHYNKLFNGQNTDILFKSLAIESNNALIDDTNSVKLSLFTINHTTSLLHNFSLEDISLIVEKLKKTEDFPHFYLLIQNLEYSTIAVEESVQHAKDMVSQLFKNLIESHYDLKQDEKNNLEQLNAHLLKIRLEFNIIDNQTPNLKQNKIKI